MSREYLEIKYRCMHPSCVVNCREGVLAMGTELYRELSDACGEPDMFKSPRDACRLGFSQKFKALSVVKTTGDDSTRGEEALGPAEGPIKILMEEHRKVLGKLDEIEGHMRRRDVDALWVATAELENEIMHHSVHKEEEVLFPLLNDILPFAEGLVTVVKEDHRELVTLLHSFRNALVDGDILDGIGLSMLVNLRSHIRKEDEEFFLLIDGSLDGQRRETILEGMRKVDGSFRPMEPGDRKALRERSGREKRMRHDEAAAAAREEAQADASSGGGCCHG